MINMIYLRLFNRSLLCHFVDKIPLTGVVVGADPLADAGQQESALRRAFQYRLHFFTVCKQDSALNIGPCGRNYTLAPQLPVIAVSSHVFPEGKCAVELRLLESEVDAREGDEEGDMCAPSNKRVKVESAPDGSGGEKRDGLHASKVIKSNCSSKDSLSHTGVQKISPRPAGFSINWLKDTAELTSTCPGSRVGSVTATKASGTNGICGGTVEVTVARTGVLQGASTKKLSAKKHSPASPYSRLCGREQLQLFAELVAALGFPEPRGRADCATDGEAADVVHSVGGKKPYNTGAVKVPDICYWKYSRTEYSEAREAFFATPPFTGWSPRDWTCGLHSDDSSVPARRLIEEGNQ